LGGVNAILQRDEKYGIKRGYHHALRTVEFDDRLNKDEWQKDTYQFAASIMMSNNYTSVVDVGCGSAYKLLNLLGTCQTTGIELESTFRWLAGKYPDRNWLQFEKAEPDNLETDLVICVDVIEHCEDPRILLDFIKCIRADRVLISTPERDEVAGRRDFGPPRNIHHYREWNSQEFKKFISKYFYIEQHLIFKDRSATQVVLCK